MEDYDLLEFEKLKDEQIGRLTYRDTLFYFTMTIIGGALAIVCSAKDATQAADVLLALPFAVFIAGVAHITCDRRIEDIGIYIRDNLAAAVAEKKQLPLEKVFGWETSFRAAPLHTFRKLLQFAANVMVYSFSGLGVLCFYLLLKPNAVLNALLVGERQETSLFRVIFAAISNRQPVAKVAPVVEFWVLVVGALLMLAMAVLLVQFSMVKWKRPTAESAKQHRNRNLLRILVISAAAVAIPAVDAAAYLRPDLRNWALASLPVPPIYAIAAVVVVIAGFLLSLIRRR